MAVVIEASDVTATGQSDTTSLAVNVPNCNAGDGLIFCLCWDDSANVTAITPPSGQNGETISAVRGIQASFNTEMRMQVFETICTGSWTAGTINFGMSAQEQIQACCIRVPAGEFDSTNFIGANAGQSSASTADTNVLSPEFQANADDGDGTLVIVNGADADAITPPASGYTVIHSNAATTGFVVMVRDAAVTASESITASTSTIAGDSWASIAFIVRPAAGGASTTRGRPFGSRGTAFNGGRTFGGMLSMEAITIRGFAWPRLLNSLR